MLIFDELCFSNLLCRECCERIQVRLVQPGQKRIGQLRPRICEVGRHSCKEQAEDGVQSLPAVHAQNLTYKTTYRKVRTIWLIGVRRSWRGRRIPIRRW